ncbi:hypothetical protein GF377_02500, partial [candidate division GN15 bacterium]|nr:hypothetical protein [candidate division GN15 bacterium]
MRVYITVRFCLIVSGLVLLLLSSEGRSQQSYQTGYHKPGVDGTIFTLAQPDASRLYAGGVFAVTVYTDTIAEDFAAYDLEQKTWSDYGFDSVMSETFRFVYGISGYEGDDLIVAGRFFGLGDKSDIKNIARWDGSEWLSLSPEDSTTDGVIRSVTVVGGVIYVGGEFTHIGGVDAVRVARWDPTHGWQALGEGLGPTSYSTAYRVNALQYHNGLLYAVGEFRDPDNGSATRYENLAVWDGAVWEYLGNGVSFGEEVTDLHVEDHPASGGDRVFIAGEFEWVNGVSTEPDTITSRFVAAYLTADSSWENYDAGSPGNWEIVRSIERVNGELVIGGDWLEDESAPFSSRLAVWDETASEWKSWGYGTPDGEVRDIHPGFDDRVYVGGSFERIGTAELWDGEPRIVSGLAYRHADLADSSWYPIGDGIPLTGSRGIEAFALQIDETTNDTNVVVAGGFEAIGGVVADGLAVYTDTGWFAWLDFPSGSSSNIEAIDALGDSIVVAGYDLWAGTGDPREALALWDGTAWTDVGGGIGSSDRIDKVIIDSNGDIIIGGQFESGADWAWLKRWDGSQWTTFASVSNGTRIDVLERHPTDDTIFVAGSFASRVGIIDGSSVTPLGGDSNPWQSFEWGQQVTSILPTSYGVYMGLSRVNFDHNYLGFWRYDEDDSWLLVDDTVFKPCIGSITALEQTVGCEILLGGLSGGPNTFDCDSLPSLITYDQAFTGAGRISGLGRGIEDMIRVGDEVWIGG